MTPEAPNERHAERYPFWRYTDLLLFFGLGLPCIFAGQLLVRAFTLIFHLDVRNKGLLLIPAQFLGYGLLFLALYGIFKTQYDRPFWLSLGWVDFRFSLFATMTLGAMVAFAVAGGAVLLRTPDVDTPMREMLSKRGTAILIAIFATTIGPVCEELAFRGFMQPLLVRSFGPVRGILLTALPFGLLHLEQNAFSWRHVLLITLAGAAFGSMRHFSGSTRASTWMHAAYNFTFCLAFFAAERKLPAW